MVKLIEMCVYGCYIVLILLTDQCRVLSKCGLKLKNLAIFWFVNTVYSISLPTFRNCHREDLKYHLKLCFIRVNIVLNRPSRFVTQYSDRLRTWRPEFDSRQGRIFFFPQHADRL